MRRITAVLIDAGRVLLHPDDTLFQHAARSLGQTLTPGAAARALGRTVWEGAADDDPVAFWNTHRKIHAWSQHAGLTTSAGVAIWDHVHHADATTPLWSVAEPSAATALATLTGAGYHLAAVSNNDGRLHQQLTTTGLAPYFSAIIDSAVTGMTKPDPRIFLHAAAELGAYPDECVMIGDDPHFDIRAAIHAGIAVSILIDAHHDRPRTWPTPASPDLGTAAQLLAPAAGPPIAP